VSPSEIFELWQLIDQTAIETFSIYLAGTFAILIAAYSAGSGFRGFILYLAMSAYVVFSWMLGAFIWGLFDRIRMLSEYAESLWATNPELELLQAIYVYLPGAHYAFAGIIAVITLGTLVACYLIRLRPSSQD
jgi:hypothetical protein